MKKILKGVGVLFLIAAVVSTAMYVYNVFSMGDEQNTDDILGV